MPEITTLGELFPRQWLTPADLGGHQVRVKVSGLEIRTFRRRSGEEEPAAVLSFVAGGKPCARRMILNKTQARALAQIAGTETLREWVGVEVILAPAVAPNQMATIAILPAGRAAERSGDGNHGGTDAETKDERPTGVAAAGTAADEVQTH